MNKQQERDIIRTLVKAGAEPLAKRFAISRGYGRNRAHARDDRVPGGLGDKKTPADVDPKQLKMGIEVEMEHTDDPKLAEEIAIDHLTEDPVYYTKLAKMESKGRVSQTSGLVKRAFRGMPVTAQGFGGDSERNARNAIKDLVTLRKAAQKALQSALKLGAFTTTGAVMHEKHEKDIIRTLVKAGHDELAKSFARSRGYRVRAAKVDNVEVFWDTDSDPSNPGWVVDVMPLGKIPFAPKYYHLEKNANDRLLKTAVRETLKNEGIKFSRDLRIEIDR